MIGFGSEKGFVPLHNIRIVSAVRNRHGVDLCRLEMTNGEIVEELWSSWLGFLRTATQLLPAQAGISLLSVDTHGDDPAGWAVYRSPVIAWALCVDGEIRPVTPAGVLDGCGEPDEGVFVEMPEGRVCSASSWANESGFADADAFLVHMLRTVGKNRVGDAWAAAKAEYDRLRAFSDALPDDHADVDKAVDAYCVAMDRLIETPAPSMAEVLIKLDLTHDRQEGFGWIVSYHDAIRRDVARLAGSEAK